LALHAKVHNLDDLWMMKQHGAHIVEEVAQTLLVQSHIQELQRHLTSAWMGTLVDLPKATGLDKAHQSIQPELFSRSVTHLSQPSSVLVHRLSCTCAV